MSRRKNIKRHSKSPIKNRGQTTIVQEKRYEHHGPLPAPIDFAKYNEVVHDAGERILSMAESQAEHLHDLQNRAASSHFTEIRRGQYMAFILGVLGLFLATYLGIKGHGLLALGLALAGVSSMMSQLIGKRKK